MGAVGCRLRTLSLFLLGWHRAILVGDWNPENWFGGTIRGIRQFVELIKLLKTISYFDFTGPLLGTIKCPIQKASPRLILGEAFCLAAQVLTRPPTPAARVLLPEGEDQEVANLAPLGEVARRADGGLVVFLSTVPCTKPSHSGSRSCRMKGSGSPPSRGTRLG